MACEACDRRKDLLRSLWLVVRAWCIAQWQTWTSVWRAVNDGVDLESATWRDGSE